MSKLNNGTQYSSNQIDLTMHVVKRGGNKREPVQFDKITTRIRRLCTDNPPLSPKVDPTKIALQTIRNMCDGISTEELDKISANIAEGQKLTHPDYSTLASRILISNLHKTTPDSFSACMRKHSDRISPMHMWFINRYAAELDAMINHTNDYLFDYMGFKVAEASYMYCVNESTGVYLARDGSEVNATAVITSRLGKPVLIIGDAISAVTEQTIKRVLDRPQYMFMRVALCICVPKSGFVFGNDMRKYTVDSMRDQTLARIKQCYDMFSRMMVTHATPTIFNACGNMQQCVSCFLVGTEDSIEGINKTLARTADISKWAGGIGIHQSVIRCCGSIIDGTNGISTGLPKQLKIYNESARCWNQGGKRPGAYAIYLELWHGDILRFLSMRRAQTADEFRAQDLFYATWICDLFMCRLLTGRKWSLFSSKTAPGLNEVYDGMEVCTKCSYCANSAYHKYITIPELLDNGHTVDMGLFQNHPDCDHNFQPVDAFTQLYERYEQDGLAVDVVAAQEIAKEIHISRRETGLPYCCFKDIVNRMSMQANIGTIQSSNLCTEIMQYSDAESYACCVLCSINLDKMVSGDTFNHQLLYETVQTCVQNLDNVVEYNEYPVPECVSNAHDNRPIGIGVQGLANVFARLRLPYLSPAAAQLDKDIFETIYYAAVNSSIMLARERGAYKTFPGSPASRGLLHPDLWMRERKRMQSYDPIFRGKVVWTDPRTARYDWPQLRADVMKYGMRNSLLVAPMPTVTTSQLLGQTESFEPFPSNLYVKGTLAGEFTVVNNIMVNHLMDLGLWTKALETKIMNNNGFIGDVLEIPADVRSIYACVWELSQYEIKKRAAIRGAFIDQSQSLNEYLINNSTKTLNDSFVAGWQLGLKTGSYYTRTRAAASAMKNNISQVGTAVSAAAGAEPVKEPEAIICKFEPGCTSCGS